jgi:hypothetical protein
MDNKRKYFRMDVQGVEAYIADDIGFCSAQVKDVSRFGICLTEMPRKLRNKGDKFLLVVSDQKGHRYKVQAQSKWETERGFDTVLGAEIKNAPWGWTDFVSTKEAEGEVREIDSVELRT